MLSEQPDQHALPWFLAHVHPQADDGGDQQEAQDDFRPLVREQHADKRQQVGENSPLEMGRDADDQRKQEEGSDEKGQGLPHRQQAKQAPEGGGDPLSPLKTVKHREGVAEYRRGGNQGQSQGR